VLLFAAIVWLSTAAMRHGAIEDSAARALTPRERVFAEADGFDEVMAIVPGRCSMCHAREPFLEGIRHAPKNVLLETEADVAGAARAIFFQAGMSHAMPPANVTYMEESERRVLRDWYRAATDRGA
jgi:uncharacterized membrane protein